MAEIFYVLGLVVIPLFIFFNIFEVRKIVNSLFLTKKKCYICNLHLLGNESRFVHFMICQEIYKKVS